MKSIKKNKHVCWRWNSVLLVPLQVHLCRMKRRSSLVPLVHEPDSSPLLVEEFGFFFERPPENTEAAVPICLRERCWMLKRAEPLIGRSVIFIVYLKKLKIKKITSDAGKHRTLRLNGFTSILIIFISHPGKQCWWLQPPGEIDHPIKSLETQHLISPLLTAPR